MKAHYYKIPKDSKEMNGRDIVLECNLKDSVCFKMALYIAKVTGMNPHDVVVTEKHVSDYIEVNLNNQLEYLFNKDDKLQEAEKKLKEEEEAKNKSEEVVTT